jgi:hypothetical protein
LRLNQNDRVMERYIIYSARCRGGIDKIVKHLLLLLFIFLVGSQDVYVNKMIQNVIKNYVTQKCPVVVINVFFSRFLVVTGTVTHF